MAYIIAGIEFNKVYREETGVVTVTTWDTLGKPQCTDKQVTRCFVGNIEITEFRKGLVPCSNIPNIDYSNVNSELKSKGINLNLTYQTLGAYIDIDENNVSIELLKQGLSIAQVEFKKLEITEKPKLMIFDD